ncbi:FAD binding domain-containing protein [Mesorhizobium australicum]|uniref:FAD binding domain-containing protein n=1 Tax=Mesorhizobium australicum TaxID=536018 RepID=UPI003339D91C
MALVYVSTADRDEARRTLRRPGASIISGGTLLLRRLNEGDTSLETIVRYRDASQRAIETRGGTVRIGAAVTMAEIAARPDLGGLACAAREVGGPAVRAAATLGGNLFAPFPFGDLIPVLLVLEAEIETLEGEIIPVRQFTAERAQFGLDRRIVVAVRFDRIEGTRELYRKVTRVRPHGAPVLVVASWSRMVDGVIEDIRVAAGALGLVAQRLRDVERLLVGIAPTAQAIAEATADIAEIDPVSDAIASAWYRRKVLPVHLGRLLSGLGEQT